MILEIDLGLLLSMFKEGNEIRVRIKSGPPAGSEVVGARIDEHKQRLMIEYFDPNQDEPSEDRVQVVLETMPRGQ